MRLFARIVGAVLGVIAAFPIGQAVGCGFYEATGSRWAQCGYEFEGIEHVLISIGIGALVFGFFGQWLVARLWPKSQADEDATGS